MTTEQIVNEVVNPTVSVRVGGVDVDGSMAPQDRTFRNAWQLEGNAITVNMAQAREIHRDTLRQERAPKLAALDTEWFRAAEVDDANKKADIAEQKQALRDVTADPRIDEATTPDELKALTLEALLA